MDVAYKYLLNRGRFEYVEEVSAHPDSGSEYVPFQISDVAVDVVVFQKKIICTQEIFHGYFSGYGTPVDPRGNG